MLKTRKNMYFFVSGIISLILSAAHVGWGLTHVIPEINKLEPTATASLQVSWYQGGATLLAGGVALLIQEMARPNSKAIPALVLAVYSVNFSVFLMLVNLKNQFLMVQTVTQSVLFTIIIVLLIMGLWITPLSTRDHLISRNIKYLSVLKFRHKE